MRHPYAGVLFDMDGVLRNTEPYHHLAYARILEELSGGAAGTHSISGKSNLGLYEALVERFGGSRTPAELSRRHFELVSQLLRENGAGPMPGLTDLLDGLAERHIPYGVVSSSPRGFVEQNLRELGMLDRAVCIVTGSDGLTLKPAPDLYLEGVRQFGAAGPLLAVEDSHSGLAAAKAAGLACAAYLNPDSGQQDLSRADWQIRFLPDLLGILDGRKPNMLQHP